MDIILYLITIIQQLYKNYGWLLNFVCRHIPLRQWAFDDTHSPKYQKFTVDQPPLIIPFENRIGSSCQVSCQTSSEKEEELQFFYKRRAKISHPDFIASNKEEQSSLCSRYTVSS